MKMFQPIDKLSKNIKWAGDIPAANVRLIGLAELLGAIGLILPLVTHTLPWLTLVAAAGLVLVQLAAIPFHLGAALLK